MVEQHAHGFSEAIGTLRTKLVHDLIEQAMVVLVGVGHFGFVLFAKASKPIWPAPATRSELQKVFYTGSGDVSRGSGNISRGSGDISRGTGTSHEGPGHLMGVRGHLTR